MAQEALAGDRRALAHLLTLVEDGGAAARSALATLFPKAGQAHIVGFTGSTGAGKSSLVNCVAREVRRRGQSLAIVAVDPTSPFSGGALLGDRLRMRDLAEDPDVFIRSMASRGHPGGVAHATRDVLTVFDALSVPVILVETVGAGQVQVEVARISHTIVLVEAPGMGDEIQALKAGLMEIADIIAVNKADRPEAKLTLQAIRNARLGRAADTGHHRGQALSEVEDRVEPWAVPVVETSALESTGIGDLVDAIEAHRGYLQSGELWESLQVRHARAALEVWLQRYLRDLLADAVDPLVFEAVLQTVVRRRQDPASAARELVDRLVSSLKS